MGEREIAAAEMHLDPRAAHMADTKVYITLVTRVCGPRYRCEAELLTFYDDPQTGDRVFTIRADMASARLVK